MAARVDDDVVVVRTGSANLASVLAGLGRAGATPRLTDEVREVETAGRLVLPGVGAFGAVMERLGELGLVEVLRRRLCSGRPTLAICLGLQILATGSDESPSAAGLGVLETRVRRFPAAVRVPQLGWNRVSSDPGCELLEDGAAYFANSFCIREMPHGWNGAWSRHGEPFVAALERGAVLACQFHPELSGQWGAALLRRWLVASGGEPC